MRLFIILNIVITMMSIQTSCSTLKYPTSGKEDKKQVYKRNVGGFPVGNIFQNRFAAQSMPIIPNNTQWSQYAPNLPSPDEVDCHIEIEVTQLMGGRCVRLGGFNRMAVCQAGVHLGFSRNQCDQILAEREESVLTQAQVSQHQEQQEMPAVRKRSVTSRREHRKTVKVAPPVN